MSVASKEKREAVRRHHTPVVQANVESLKSAKLSPQRHFIRIHDKRCRGSTEMS